LRRLLPAQGKRIVEFGAGFGRLADLYAGYEQIVLLDYSRTMLEQAMQDWGANPRFVFVAADIYHLPFAESVFDAATMIRVIHHIAKVPAALAQIRRVMTPGGVFVLEFANKRHIKAVARHLLRRQTWNPFDPHPFEFVKLNFDFHPSWMLDQLRQAGFATRRKLSVSYLRAGFIKRRIPVEWMVYADAILQRTAWLGLWSPSVFTQNIAASPDQKDSRRSTADAPSTNQSIEAIFRSPRSGQPLRREGNVLVCDADGTRWRVQGNFYDFKENV
ncbi:MAG: class I SAM-dependent methyltransferase, partial [Anaerolineae bacterium]|nr:class I SAM-dependent methyltransferase [Thermoflexales bacterium]MDW8407141.1 class I SAM-dependent methyltransferase [Anaerolineae bacterium]